MHRIITPGIPMTPQERARMNDLCTEIQNEKDYAKFEELTREVTALMSAKARRFPENKFSPAGNGRKVLQATATRTVSVPGFAELVEIRLAEAQPLYGEIRVENSFTDSRGAVLALQPPAPIDVTLSAPADRLGVKLSR
jgi:hypothetical protein